uniref:Androgen-induced gene 1 protein-like isoform X1 n=1 Tax=Pogona vitticeps TaxID=103695 RepID=A0A6J0UH16_9SAUR
MALALRGRRAVALLHALCLLWALFALSQNLGVPTSVRKAQDDTYGGHWKHLTFLNQVLQTLLYILCAVIEGVALCIPSKERTVSSVLLPIRDFIFSVYVFPVGLFGISSITELFTDVGRKNWREPHLRELMQQRFVAVAFWGLFAYDRELVYPKELDDINPSWLNHTMHTTILPLLFIEMVICVHKYPDRFKGILGLSFFAFTYLVWVLWVHHVSGIWAYPVLGVLSPCGIVGFFFVALAIMIMFYFIGEQLTKWLWARRRKKCT